MLLLAVAAARAAEATPVGEAPLAAALEAAAAPDAAAADEALLQMRLCADAASGSTTW